MIIVDYDVEIEHEFTATGSGDGFWGCAKGEELKFYYCNIRVTHFVDDDEWIGHIQFFHNTLERGLAYSDPGIRCDVVEEFMKSFSEFDDILDATTIDGSEQGMQASYMLDCDVSCRKGITPEKLLKLGFKSVDV